MFSFPTLGTEESKNPSNVSINWNKDDDEKKNKYSLNVIKNKPQIDYDYTQLKIVPEKQISKTMNKDGYCRVLFQNDLKKTTPHLFFSSSPSVVVRYFVQSLTILATPEPKLVIENQPITQGPAVYIHIPLNKKERLNKDEDTQIDHLLDPAWSEEIVLDINSLLGTTTCAFFNGQSILLTKTAIPIYTDLKKFQGGIFPEHIYFLNLKYDTTLYEIVNLEVVGNKPMSSKPPVLIEGLEDQVYDCETVDIGEEEVTYMQVPMYSEIIGSQVSINMLQGMFYMFFLALVILLSFYIIPFFTFSDNATDEILKKEGTICQLLIPTFMFIGGLGLLVDALVYKKSLPLTNASTLIMMFSIILFFAFFSKEESKRNYPDNIGTTITKIFKFGVNLNNGSNSDFTMFIIYLLFIVGVPITLILVLNIYYPNNWMTILYCFSFWWALHFLAYYCIKIIAEQTTTT